MESKTITGAAALYYKENVEGEPLTQDVPLACFKAGAQFVIDSQKKRNNCNIPEGNSYKSKTKRMKDIHKEIVGKVEDVIVITGFYITAAGDPDVGIPSASWEMNNDFYFETPQELEIFRKEIKQLYEFHCGEPVSVVTFEEYKAEYEAELIEEYKQYPVRYLIRGDYGDMYMRPAPLTGMYSSDVAECIHYELEDWIKDSEKIIPSTSDEYWTIIKKALHEKQQSLNVNGQHYHSAKNSVQLLIKELNYGK